MNPELNQTSHNDIRNPEFLVGLREKIVNRILDQYPEADNEDFLHDFRLGKVKPGIDSWAGDAFAWVAHEEERLNPEDYEYLRGQLFSN